MNFKSLFFFFYLLLSAQVRLLIAHTATFFSQIQYLFEKYSRLLLIYGFWTGKLMVSLPDKCSQVYRFLPGS